VRRRLDCLALRQQAGGGFIKDSMNDEKQQLQRPITNLFGLLLTIAVIIWQSITVGRYIAVFPSSLWNGTTQSTLNESCSGLFMVMHWTVFLTVFVVLAEMSMLLVILMPGVRICCLPCLGLCACADGVAQITKVVFAIWGIIEVLNAKKNEVTTCSDLYSCAWWTYLGFFLVSMALCCLCCCCCGQRPKGPTEATPLRPGSV